MPIQIVKSNVNFGRTCTYLRILIAHATHRHRSSERKDRVTNERSFARAYKRLNVIKQVETLIKKMQQLAN